jgi:Chloramphenicol phosphotransferase-like protein
MSGIIFLFGPSCSGKSTLGNALQNSLGNGWTYIDRDELIEQNICTDSTADKTLEERIQLIRNKIIIDAQIPWREKRNGEFYFMVLPPLEVLLKRDTNRTEKLQRTEKQAHYAQEYVIETFKILSSLDTRDFNYCFDSSRVSGEEEVGEIFCRIHAKR